MKVAEEVVERVEVEAEEKVERLDLAGVVVIPVVITEIVLVVVLQWFRPLRLPPLVLLLSQWCVFRFL